MSVCPICHDPHRKIVYSIGTWSIDECRTCCFAWIDPMPSRSSRPDFYSPPPAVCNRGGKKRSLISIFSRGMKHFSTRLMNRNKVKSEVFYEALSRHLRPGAFVLDVGCGDGSFLRLAQNRFTCTGIEISPAYSILAKQQAGAEVLTCDFLNADLGARRFDGVTLISLLEHLDDPVSAVQKCYGLLNPGGILLMKTVNYGCLNRKLKKGKWTGFRPPDHLVYFNPANLRRLLTNAGFKKITIRSWPFNDNMYCQAQK